MEDFREWGVEQQLTEDTIFILIDNGVNSCAALAALTAEDLPALGLKLGQTALVHRFINAEPTSSTTVSIVRTLQVCALHAIWLAIISAAIMR